MKNFKCRYYNKLQLSGNKIIKHCSIERLEREIKWFCYSRKYFPDNTPVIYNIHKDDDKRDFWYSMQYIKGDNFFDWIKKQDSKQIVSNTFEKLIDFHQEKLHQSKSKINNEDIHSMYYTKPLESLQFYANYKDNNFDQYVINGKHMPHPKYMLKKVYKDLHLKLKKTYYCFIHGDTTFGNTLISKDNNLYLIDPRGSFGKTELFGDPRYDFAKTYFSFAGNFDSLNNNLFKVSKVCGNKYFYEIEDLPNTSGLEKIFFQKIHTDRILIKYIHSTIWLSLMPHLQNSKEQMLTAFLNGTVLLNEIYSNI
jgi:tRNA A-37 threonylcarbamoyl transferase component Bud32